jgi:hypothetical protein
MLLKQQILQFLGGWCTTVIDVPLAHLADIGLELKWEA